MDFINSKQDLINYFQEGCKKEDQLSIGVEHEKFIFQKKSNQRANFQTISKIFDYLTKFGWKPIEEANNSIRYLQTQLENTDITDMRRVFFELIEEQTKIAMLAEVKPEFAFSTIDPPVIPDKKVGPNRFVICVWAAFFGLFLGVVLSFVMYLKRG